MGVGDDAEGEGARRKSVEHAVESAAAWKSNTNVNYGGTLLVSHSGDYANQLATYVNHMQTFRHQPRSGLDRKRADKHFV